MRTLDILSCLINQHVMAQIILIYLQILLVMSICVSMANAKQTLLIILASVTTDTAAVIVMKVNEPY